MPVPAVSPRLAALLALAALVLPGCAAMRSYDSEMRETLARTTPGQVQAAIQTLEKNNKGDKDLLYYMEMGELQRLALQYDKSQTAWMAGDRTVQAWEAAAKLNPLRVSGSVGSYLINDKVRTYEGQDFEKVMLTTRIALNFLAEGNWDNARVAIKQTHEREAVIADVRAKQYVEIEQEAKKKGATTNFRELSGYPVASLDTPSVRALKNSYQSAFSHYLAGFIYESLGEAGLAAPGYRQALELYGRSGPLDDALSGLDQRMAARDDGLTDVLFEIETGLVPARVSKEFALPMPINDKIVLVAVSFPVMQTQEPAVPVSRVVLQGGPEIPAVQITSVDAMARRSLEDEMPGIMLRGFVRSTSKAIAQYEMQRQAQQQNNDGAAAALGIMSLALMIGSAVTEKADEREWRLLPASINIARAKVPPGSYTVTVETADGPQSVRVNIGGRHAFIALRLLRGRLFAMLPPIPAEGAPPGAESTQAPPDAPGHVSTTMEVPHS